MHRLTSRTFAMLFMAGLLSARADQSGPDWKTYFGLTPAEKKLFDDANKAKGQTEKQERADQENALEDLQRRVDAQAADAEIGSAFAKARQAIAAIPKTEDAYWDGLGAILTPTQQAKLYLKGKPAKK